jgi:hypothetical protein
MITSSGPICDVCGKYILPLDPEERVHSFGVKGIERTLHCDNACKEKLLAAGNDWTLLPPGPLRTAFEEYTAEQENENEAGY